MAAAPKKGLVALFKRGWNEIPEVVAGCCLGISGIALGIFAVHNYYKKDGDNRKYKDRYMVLRHDDPKVARIRCD